VNKKVLVIAIVSLALTAFPAFRGANAESFCFSKKVVNKLYIEIAKQMQEMKLPGIVVLISVPGEGEYISVKGKANLETERARNYFSKVGSAAHPAPLRRSRPQDAHRSGVRQLDIANCDIKFGLGWSTGRRKPPLILTDNACSTQER